MIGSRFIDKNLADSMDRYQNYSKHLQKLQEIQFEIEERRRKNAQGEQIMPKMHQPTMSLMNKKQIDLQTNVHKNKNQAFKHNQKEKLNEINRENMKILNKLVEISKGKQSTYGQKKRSVTNQTFYKSQMYGGFSLHERSSLGAPFNTSIGNYSNQGSPSPRRANSGGNSTRRQEQSINTYTSVYTGALNSGRKTSSNGGGSPSQEVTLHFFARKKEYERIDQENRKIKKHIDTQKPVLSLRKMERDFQHHIKVRGLLQKGIGLLPIQSFQRKREEITMRGYLPPLTTDSPGRRQQAFSPQNVQIFSGRSSKNQNRDIYFRETPVNFDYMLYDDPKLAQYMRDKQQNKRAITLENRNLIQVLPEQRQTDEYSADDHPRDAQQSHTTKHPINIIDSAQQVEGSIPDKLEYKLIKESIDSQTIQKQPRSSILSNNTALAKQSSKIGHEKPAYKIGGVPSMNSGMSKQSDGMLNGHQRQSIKIRRKSNQGKNQDIIFTDDAFKIREQPKIPFTKTTSNADSYGSQGIHGLAKKRAAQNQGEIPINVDLDSTQREGVKSIPHRQLDQNSSIHSNVPLIGKTGSGGSIAEEAHSSEKNKHQIMGSAQEIVDDDYEMDYE